MPLLRAAAQVVPVHNKWEMSHASLSGLQQHWRSQRHRKLLSPSQDSRINGGGSSPWRLPAWGRGRMFKPPMRECSNRGRIEEEYKEFCPSQGSPACPCHLPAKTQMQVSTAGTTKCPNKNNLSQTKMPYKVCVQKLVVFT